MVVLTLLVMIGLDSAVGAPKPLKQVKSALNTRELATLTKRAQEYQTTLPKAASMGIDEIVAYEEHKDFVCIVGKSSGGAKGPSLLRRMILIKPSTLVIDDRITGVAEGEKFPWRLWMKRAGENVTFALVYPNKFRLYASSKEERVDYSVPCKNGVGRVVSVIAFGPKKSLSMVSTFDDKPLKFHIVNDGVKSIVTLPAGVELACSIAITDSKGKTLLAERVLPSGIMPHGPKGVKMLAGWDSRYVRKNSAPWDTRQVAVELKKAVENGTIKPGRAVVLGCGAGTNSIYLASKGFDVTAMDVAPTALAMAKARADKAKVKVNWMLVDVTKVPTLKPFDFMFDRGCYHGVRRSLAKEFVESSCKLSKPGTKFLILAGNANEARHYGPPRVKEEDIRKDFTSSFDFTWLRESQFGPDGEKGKGPLMWSILMTRKNK
jgi:SAM-dependent methyltransferase